MYRIGFWLAGEWIQGLFMRAWLHLHPDIILPRVTAEREAAIVDWVDLKTGPGSNMFRMDLQKKSLNLPMFGG